MDLQRTIEAIWRMESARLVASVVRLVRDVGLAEEIVQEVFVVAMESWPTAGLPPNPRAWLLLTARHKAIDLIRREHSRDAKYALLANDLRTEPAGIDTIDTVDDDLLALMFTACHPVLPRESRVALTLRLLGGLTTDEIARAFLVPSATIGQRISRAKRTLTEAHVRYEVPGADELNSRLPSVLEVIYLIFTEGYAATSGTDWVRRDLAGEAMRLGRVLAALLNRQPETHGLLALMELQASRFDARTGPSGAPVLLQDQDRSRWDRTLIRHGLAALDTAIRLGRPLGPYTLQAAIAGCHARARSFEDDGLGGGRRPLRRAGPDRTVAGGRAQPDGGRDVRRRPGGRTAGAGRGPGRSAARASPPARRRARRHLVAARAVGRGRGGAGAGGRPGPYPTRDGTC